MKGLDNLIKTAELGGQLEVLVDYKGDLIKLITKIDKKIDRICIKLHGKTFDEFMEDK